MLSLSRQCELLGLARSTAYYVPVGESVENLQLMRAIDEQYHREQPTLIVVEQQSLLPQLFEQSFDLSVLELDDLLLTLVDKATEGCEQSVPRLKQDGYVRRRK